MRKVLSVALWLSRSVGATRRLGAAGGARTLLHMRSAVKAPNEQMQVCCSGQQELALLAPFIPWPHLLCFW